MTANPDTRTKSPLPSIVAAGDVCIDWLSIPLESRVPEPDSREPMNWQLRGGRHMYARRGGAWLTADFVEQAVGTSAKVLKSAKEELDLESVPPEKVIHSMIMLGRGERERNKKKDPYWVATTFEGYAGPPYPKPPEVKPVENDDSTAGLVLLDDAGNGFRDREDAWPAALKQDCEPLIIYKVRRPLDKGILWDCLKGFHLSRTIAVLGADELRGEGGCISRGLSWERTATDLILSLAREPKVAGLRGCPFLIVSLGIEGAVLVRCVKGRISGAHLWYLPNRTEGEVLRTGRGKMSGFGAAFAAAITAALFKSGAHPSQGPAQTDKIGDALHTGIRDGLVVVDRLLEEAFGPCETQDPDAKSRMTTRSPEYPLAEIFGPSDVKAPPVCDVALPALPAQNSPKELSRFRSWRILDSNREELFSDLAAEVVRRGVDKVFPDVPIGKFGKLSTLDRSEIESYRSVRNLIEEFLGNPRPQRPLCLAVFGPPGGGKSFGVTEVARSLDPEGRIEKLNFNVSQWNGPEYLVSALHRVRDYAIGGKVPLVFFDEFDSQFLSQKLGWLKYFLAPMQDGIFADGLFTHEIGKAIFVFAGGTSATYGEFRAAVKSADAEKDDLRSAKLPDFDSRLRGHVDIFGLDPPTDTNLLRRALVLRSNIEKTYPTLIDASGTARIDGGVLRAFLQTPGYYHGARSLEAILEMSHLSGRIYFDPSLLPPQHQLNLHVDANAFMVLVQHQPPLAPKIQQIAKDIHELYVESELAKKDKDGKLLNEIGAWRSLYHWEDPRLDELYRRSSREQAAYYPTLLAAAGCSFEEGAPDREFKFSDAESEKLARMEHDRWTEERRIKQPDHPDLVPWEELSKEEQDKDNRMIEAIPKTLGEVGLRLVRLS